MTTLSTQSLMLAIYALAQEAETINQLIAHGDSDPEELSELTEHVEQVQTALIEVGNIYDTQRAADNSYPSVEEIVSATKTADGDETAHRLN
ncbi:MAG: hypothetical protein HKM24_01475 [Gammaproteobacteria bacterium]|nr:hypothetical protein [Gammaproteobacteria bacterium]